MAVLVFRSAAEWEDMLATATEASCIRALRTKNERVPLERDAHLAEQRMRRISPKRRRLPQAKPLGPLTNPTD